MISHDREWEVERDKLAERLSLVSACIPGWPSWLPSSWAAIVAASACQPAASSSDQSAGWDRIDRSGRPLSVLQPPVRSAGSSQFAHESRLCCPALLCASLQVLAIGVFRFRLYMDWLTVLWLAAYCGGVTAQAALRRRHRSLYLRLRPYTAAAFRAAGLGLGCATLLKQRMLEDGLHAAPPNGHVDNAVVSVLRIVFTSGGATMLLFAFGWQTWLRWVEGRVVRML